MRISSNERKKINNIAIIIHILLNLKNQDDNQISIEIQNLFIISKKIWIFINMMNMMIIMIIFFINLFIYYIIIEISLFLMIIMIIMIIIAYFINLLINSLINYFIIRKTHWIRKYWMIIIINIKKMNNMMIFFDFVIKNMFLINL